MIELIRRFLCPDKLHVRSLKFLELLQRFHCCSQNAKKVVESESKPSMFSFQLLIATPTLSQNPAFFAGSFQTQCLSDSSARGKERDGREAGGVAQSKGKNAHRRPLRREILLWRSGGVGTRILVVAIGGGEKIGCCSNLP